VNLLEGALRRERAAVALALLALVALAWWQLWRGAGMGMSGLAMTRLVLFPHLAADGMEGMAMPEVGWPALAAMWWVMMVAMMTPSAAPLVLLYAKVMRHHAQSPGEADGVAAGTALLASGYLLAWLGFSLAATAAQVALQGAGLLSPMMLWSRSAWLSAAVLVAAGAYQLSPWKHACLRHCRGPAQFLVAHRRPGRLGALVMGLHHGAWCVGCCAVLMALLFVGGVMNLVWIAALTGLVLMEKLAPAGALVGRVTGVVLIAWGVATLLV